MLASLERDVFPGIGTLPLVDVTTPVVLKTLRVIEARGSVETARRIQQRVNAVIALARSEGWCEHDSAGDVVEALARARAPRRRPPLVDAGELRQLLTAADLVDAPVAVKLASRFLALTAVRLVAVRGARWREIEDLDGAAPIWRVTALLRYRRTSLPLPKLASVRWREHQEAAGSDFAVAVREVVCWPVVGPALLVRPGEGRRYGAV